MHDIVIYSSSLCGFCHAAKHLLANKGLAFEEILVDDQPALRADVIQRSGQRTVPQIWIGGHHVGGYTDLVELDKRGELEQLLHN